jgi:hypothetical protein
VLESQRTAEMVRLYDVDSEIGRTIEGFACLSIQLHLLLLVSAVDGPLQGH